MKGVPSTLVSNRISTARCSSGSSGGSTLPGIGGSVGGGIHSPEIPGRMRSRR